MIARIRKSMEDKDQGFTLIELLVVMIIIGILAAIAVPVFLNQRKSAVDASMKSDLRSAGTVLETHYVDNQVYPAAQTNFDALAVKKDADTVLTYTLDIDGTAFCVKASRATGKQPGTKDWYYDSNAGGLLKGTATC